MSTPQTLPARVTASSSLDNHALKVVDLSGLNIHSNAFYRILDEHQRVAAVAREQGRLKPAMQDDIYVDAFLMYYQMGKAVSRLPEGKPLTEGQVKALDFFTRWEGDVRSALNSAQARKTCLRDELKTAKTAEMAVLETSRG